ncbi:MAG: Fe-S-containing hydro-lyase [Treponema sp.]|nr:Fe-S-containing hydro-lyase [Treponema sp.]
MPLPLRAETAAALAAGDRALLTGVLYTARDAAHKALAALLAAGRPLPFPIKDAVIYYTGPCPAAPGQIIGAAGPTTGGRMDPYTPALLALGLRGMIGKGRRSPEVVDAMRRAGAVYFGALGGAGALLAARIKTSRIVAFPELGAEAIRELYVEEFPVTVIIDSKGNDLYVSGREEYLRSAGMTAEEM